VKILFLADPNSIHDIKWISWFSDQHQCYILARKHHLEGWDLAKREAFKMLYKIEIVASVEDFSVRRLFNTFWEWRKIKALLSRYQIGVFHIMFAEPNALWCIFRPSTLNVKYVLTTRGTDVLKTIPAHFSKGDLLNKLVSALYKLAFRKFDIITCTSKSQERNVKMIAPSSRVEIVRTGVDVEAIIATRAEHLPNKLIGVRYILFPRNMQPLYNHEFSMEAIRKLPAEILEQFKFVFVDADSKNQVYVQRIQAMMTEFGAHHFCFLPRQSQQAIWALYKNASLVIMNPVSDGAPVSGMEVMICNRPLILGNVDYDEDIFGDTCFKLTEWNADQLAEMITAIVSNTVSFNTKYAFTRVIEKGNRNVEMNRLLHLYQE
jgi:hypothetical protein